MGLTYIDGDRIIEAMVGMTVLLSDLRNCIINMEEKMENNMLMIDMDMMEEDQD